MMTYHADEAGDVEPDGIANVVWVFDVGLDGIQTHVLAVAIHIVVEGQGQVVLDFTHIIARGPLLLLLIKINTSARK